MAQILAPSTLWQMGTPKNSTCASPITTKMWSSLLLKQNKAVKTPAKYRVLSVKSESGTINRLEKLLNLDVTPYTNKIIAEYIWYNIFGNMIFYVTNNTSKQFLLVFNENLECYLFSLSEF